VGCGRTSAVPSGLATFGVQPSVETLSYSRLSLRDTKAAVFPRGQYSPGVQQYDLWIMTNSWGRAGLRASAARKNSVISMPISG